MKAGLLPFSVRFRDRRTYFAELQEASHDKQGPLIIVDFIVQQRTETLLSALGTAGSHAAHIFAAFQDKPHEVNWPDFDEFVEAAEGEIATVVNNFTANVGFGAKKAVRESVPVDDNGM